MGPMRPARMTEARVQVTSWVGVELPDGTGATLHNTRIEVGGTIPDAATAAGRRLEADVDQQIDAMVAVIAGGTSIDGEQLFMELGQPWLEEEWGGAVIDAEGLLWVQMDNWPGEQWMSPHGHGVRDWPELVFPVKLAGPGWAKGLSR